MRVLVLFNLTFAGPGIIGGVGQHHGGYPKCLPESQTIVKVTWWWECHKSNKTNGYETTFTGIVPTENEEQLFFSVVSRSETKLFFRKIVEKKSVGRCFRRNEGRFFSTLVSIQGNVVFLCRSLFVSFPLFFRQAQKLLIYPIEDQVALKPYLVVPLPLLLLLLPAAGSFTCLASLWFIVNRKKNKTCCCCCWLIMKRVQEEGKGSCSTHTTESQSYKTTSAAWKSRFTLPLTDRIDLSWQSTLGVKS